MSLAFAQPWADVSTPAVLAGQPAASFPCLQATWARPCQSPGWLLPPPLRLPQARPQQNIFKKCVRGIPLMPKILPWLPLALAINSQLLIVASAHLRGRRPCVFLLCSLTTLNRPGSCLSRDFCLAFLCLACSLQSCRFLPSRSQLKYHLLCGGRGRASVVVLPGPPLLPIPLWHLTFSTLLRACVLESIHPGVNCLSPHWTVNSKGQGAVCLALCVAGT